MKCMFTHSVTPHESASKATEQCGCNTDDCAAMRRRCVFQLSVLLVSVSKCGKILLHNGFVFFPPLVKHAGVRGRTDLSVTSAPPCSQTLTSVEFCITLSSDLFWEELKKPYCLPQSLLCLADKRSKCSCITTFQAPSVSRKLKRFENVSNIVLLSFLLCNGEASSTSLQRAFVKFPGTHLSFGKTAG